MKSIIVIFSTIIIALVNFSANAGHVVACQGQLGDYSDAKSHQVACSKTQRWQSLGAMTASEARNESTRHRVIDSMKRLGWDTSKYGGTGTLTQGGRQGNGYYTPGRNEAYKLSNSYKSYTQESSAKDVDEGDNGVMWRTKNEDGTWSDWTNSGTMYRGQEAQFKFSMWRAQEGNHGYDKLKAWIDWSGKDGFNNDASGDELLIDKNWYKNHNASDRWDTSSHYWNSATRTRNSSDLFREYIVTKTVPMFAALGDIWMRARVTCSHSLAKYSKNFDLLPWGYQDQGEVEDFKLTIASRTQPVTPVPEPSTLIFFTALLGVMLRNRGTLAAKA